MTSIRTTLVLVQPLVHAGRIGKMFETQIKAGLVPAGLPFDMSKYITGRFPERARPSVKFD